MRSRRAVLITSVLLLLAFVVPTATAQPKPTVDVIVEWAMDHDSMELPEDGRTDMDLVVNVMGVDFVCAQPMKFKVEIDMGTIPKWAGASPVPRTVPTNGFFVFDGFKPGMTRAAALGSGNAEA